MSHLLCEKNGSIALLRLNRPKSLNALNIDLARALAEAFIGYAHDDTTRVIVVTGEGSAFCAGGDLRETISNPKGAPAGFHRLATNVHQAIIEMRRLKKPVVAAINGVAAGGGFSLALSCDFRIMAASATMKQAYTSKGLAIDSAGTYFLPRLVGLSRAMEIAALDPTIKSAEALDWGLVNRVVPDAKLLETSIAFAENLCSISVNSFAYSKQLLNDSFNNSLEYHLELERQAIVACAAHPDGIEGVTAFQEKRPAVFR